MLSAGARVDQGPTSTQRHRATIPASQTHSSRKANKMALTSLVPNLGVRSVKEALEFYGDRLGFETVMTFPETPDDDGDYMWGMARFGDMTIMFQANESMEANIWRSRTDLRVAGSRSTSGLTMLRISTPASRIRLRSPSTSTTRRTVRPSSPSPIPTSSSWCFRRCPKNDGATRMVGIEPTGLPRFDGSDRGRLVTMPRHGRGPVSDHRRRVRRGVSFCLADVWLPRSLIWASATERPPRQT